MDNQQLSILKDESSETIPRKGSRLEKILIEKPNIILNKFICKEIDKNINNCIYMIYTLHNDTFYIGSAKNLKRRFSRHESKLKTNKHHSSYMQKVYNKYGEGNFYYLVLEITDDLVEKEIYWIEYLDSYKNGYNGTLDTRRNLITPEMIQKNVKRTSIPLMVFDRLGNFIERISSVSEAARKYGTGSSNISRCCSGHFKMVKKHKFIYEKDYIENADYSTKHIKLFTEEHKNNLSKSLQGRKKSKEHREKLSIIQGIAIRCVNDNKEFVSCRECARFYNITPTSIRRSIKEKRHCKGLQFEIIKI